MKPNPVEVTVLGYPVARLTLEEAARWLLWAAWQQDRTRMVVTLNPELVVRAQEQPRLRCALERSDLTVADGVGVLWAARRAGQVLPERVPGVDLVCRTMELGGQDLRVYFLGGRPGVAERAARTAQARWGVEVAGSHDGYFDSAEAEAVAERVAVARPHLLLAGLGERQEEFLADFADRLGVRAMVGVGGTLDVLAGEARRTPAWTHRLHIEWAWRVGLDRKRWHRVPRLIQFVRLVLANDTRSPSGKPRGS